MVLSQPTGVLPGYRVRTLGGPGLGRGSFAGQAIAFADYAFCFYVLLISADAFTYLNIHNYLWLLAYGYFFMRVALSFRAFLAFVSRNVAYLVYPALCAVSVLWSDLVVNTATFSLQLIVTVLIALFIGMRLSVGEIFRMQAVVLLLLLLASFATLHGMFTEAFDEVGHFKGVFQSKNAFGHRSVMFVVAAVFVVVLLRRQPLLLKAGCALGLLATAFMVAMSGSATAVVLTIAMGGAGPLLYLGLTRRAGLPLLLGAGACVVGLAIMVAVILQVNFIEALFGALGKDTTMTGRTVLWDFGWAVYKTRPILGFGAAGFWDNPLYFGEIAMVQRVYGEGVVAFHNLIVELLVMLGPLGVASHFLMVAVTLHRALLMVRRSRDAMAVWAITMTLALFGMALLGPQLFNPHAIPLIVLISVGAALGKDLNRRPRRTSARS